MASSAPSLLHSSPKFTSRAPHFCSSSNSSSSSPSCSSSWSFNSWLNNNRRVLSCKFCKFSGINMFLKPNGLSAQAMNTTQGNFTSLEGLNHVSDEPDHLLVLVHGIMASPNDWTYVEVELKRRLGRNFLIYASSCNTYTKTFGGIDGAGKRLADEVLQVVKKAKTLKKISFLAHSLGGLFARYAISVLYTPILSTDHSDDISSSPNENSKAECSLNRALIAGLMPINFITLATPHLGVRGKNQLPFLLGVPILEKIAAPVAALFVGRTGSQLFLTDGKSSRPPLLLRMASDSEDGKFISALGAFRCRMIYANVSYDRILIVHMHVTPDVIYVFLLLCCFIPLLKYIVLAIKLYLDMVGWRTSSIRREKELVKPPLRSLDGYKHVVDVEYCPPVASKGPQFPPEAAKAKEAAQNTPSTQNTVEYHEIVEEEMISGLQQLGWRKVDVSFHSSLWPFFAHNNIHVKNEWFHNAGAGVISHVADSLKQQEKEQESSSHITAHL